MRLHEVSFVFEQVHDSIGVALRWWERSVATRGSVDLDAITPERCRTLYSKLRFDVSPLLEVMLVLVEKSVRILIVTQQEYAISQ